MDAITVREVTLQEFNQFKNEYPFERFDGIFRDFEEDCLDHTEPSFFCLVIGAFINDRLVGLMSYQTVYPKVDEYKVKSLITTPQDNQPALYYIYSTLTHPDFRKKGICSAMLAHLEKNKGDEQYIGMYPVSPGSQGLCKKLGYRHIPSVCPTINDVAKQI